MKKTTKGLVAGAAGAALLVSGATFALWSDSTEPVGGTITTGNLAVAAVAPVWQDVSGDRADSPHDIDLETFTMVPKDTIRGTFGIDAALEGENIVAALSLSGMPTVDDEDNLLKALLPSSTYQVRDVANNNVVASGKLLDLASLNPAALAHFASTDNGNSQLPKLPTSLDGTAEYELILDITFPEVDGRTLTQASGAISNLGFSLQQVRGAGVDGGS